MLLNKWNIYIAKKIAYKENIKLNFIGWKIILFIRKQIIKYNFKPNYKNIIEYINKNNSIIINTNYIYQIFPKGIYKQAFKIAGINNNLCI